MKNLTITGHSSPLPPPMAIIFFSSGRKTFKIVSSASGGKNYFELMGGGGIYRSLLKPIICDYLNLLGNHLSSPFLSPSPPSLPSQ